MKIPILNKLQKIGNLDGKIAKMEVKSGLPKKFKVPKVNIKWQMKKN